MKNFGSLFKDRGIGFWLAIAAGAVSLVTAIVYLVYAVSVGLFVPGIFVFLLLAALSTAVAFFETPGLTLLPVVLNAVALGWHIFDRVEMFAYMATGVYGMGETGAIFEVVVFIFVLMGIASVLSVLSNFMNYRKGGKELPAA